MITKYRLVVDTTDLTKSDQVASYITSSTGTLISHTTVGGKEALDVNIANIAESGIFAEDDAHVSGDNGQFILAVRNDADTSLVSADGDYSPLQTNSIGQLKVAGSFLSNYEYAEDSAHSSGDVGAFTLAVRNDAETSLVSTDGDYAPLQVDSTGRLKVAADISVVTGFEKAEDSAHSSGDIGGYMLSVRQDLLASSTSTDGDYQSFKTDALGRLYNNDTNQTGAYGSVSVATTATDLVASDLTNRKRILVQNVGNKEVYIGLDASVTTANGILMIAGGAMELDIGPSLDIHAISASGTQDIRVMELG